MSTTSTEQTTETTEEEGAGGPQTAEEATEAPEGTGTEEEPPEDDTGTDETFSAEYVQELRDEAASQRVKAKRADDLAQRLHTALTAATGRLADPSDLPYDESHLDDAESLTAAIDALLEAKPHLASRKPSGDVGQGATGDSGGVDLAGMLRARA